MNEKKNKLKIVKDQKWFYEFDLPDGTRTESYLQEDVRKIHITRETVLRNYFLSHQGIFSTALDVACHEGYYSIVMSDYCVSVLGIDKKPESIEKAEMIADVLDNKKTRFIESTLENLSETEGFDFVLCYGLLYHAENTIQLLRKLALLTRKTLCIETQVLPFQMNGRIEDGNYMWQRDLKGLFGLCQDYSGTAEGGLSDIALIPSRDALEYLLEQFGFKNVYFYKPNQNDYEQFVRNSRVIIFAEK